MFSVRTLASVFDRAPQAEAGLNKRCQNGVPPLSATAP